MTKKEFLAIWETLPADEETKNYKPCDSDKFVKIGGYLFAVQKNGNVIMKKCFDSHFSIYEVFRCFRIWCMSSVGIQYLRVEGTKTRYNFLKRMFPHTSILKDDEEKERNVFYIKVYD